MERARFAVAKRAPRFGRNQRRILMVELSCQANGSRGSLFLLDERGMCKRTFASTDLIGLARRKDLWVRLQFGSGGVYKKPTSRDVQFESEADMLRFIALARRLNPRLTIAGDDAPLVSPVTGGDGSSEDELDEDETQTEDDVLPLVAPKHSRFASLAAGEVREEWVRFHAQRFNRHGQREGAVLLLSTSQPWKLRLRPLDPSTPIVCELPLKLLQRVVRHGSSGRAASIEYVREGQTSRERLVFEGNAVVEYFLNELSVRRKGRGTGSGTPLVVLTEACNPEMETRTLAVGRGCFSLVKYNKAGVRLHRTFITDLCHGVIREFKSADLPAGIAEESCSPHKSLFVDEGALQLERVADISTRLRMSTCDESVAVQARLFSELDFEDVSERTRFEAELHALALPQTLRSVCCDDPLAPLAKGYGSAGATGGSGAQADRLLRMSPDSTVGQSWRAVGLEWFSTKRRIYVGTFNVGDASPPDDSDMKHWVRKPSDYDAGRPCACARLRLGMDSSEENAWNGEDDPAPALYVFAMQESAAKFDAWVKALGAYLGSGYRLVVANKLWEIGLVIFVAAEELPYITGVDTGSEATGVGVAKGLTGVQLGNKGGTAVGLRWHDVSYAFVSAHLAAKTFKIQNRNNDYSQILSHISLGGAATVGLELTHAFEHVFFVGDLNYRVDWPFNHAVELAARGDWAELHKEDQLLKEIQAGRCFFNWKTEPPMFMPTYRWKKGKREFSNKREQSPSYTDRVLWTSRSGAEKNVVMKTYGCADELMCSDHRPVYATFEVSIRRPYTPWPVHPLVLSSLDRSELPWASSFSRSASTVVHSVKRTSFAGVSRQDAAIRRPHSFGSDAKLTPRPPCTGTWLPSVVSSQLARCSGARGFLPEIKLMRLRLQLLTGDAGVRLPIAVGLRVQSSVLHDAEVFKATRGATALQDWELLESSHGDVAQGANIMQGSFGAVDMFYAWCGESVPRLKTLIWDPLYLCTQHLLFTVQRASKGPGSKASSSNENNGNIAGSSLHDDNEGSEGTITDDTVQDRAGVGHGGKAFMGQAAVPLRDAVEAARRRVESGRLQWTRNAAPLIPFSEPVIRAGLMVGTITGEIQLLPGDHAKASEALGASKLEGGRQMRSAHRSRGGGDISGDGDSHAKADFVRFCLLKRDDDFAEGKIELKRAWAVLGPDGKLSFWAKRHSNVMPGDDGQSLLQPPLSAGEGKVKDKQAEARVRGLKELFLVEVSDKYGRRVLLGAKDENDKRDWFAAIRAIQLQYQAINAEAKRIAEKQEVIVPPPPPPPSAVPTLPPPLTPQEQATKNALILTRMFTAVAGNTPTADSTAEAITKGDEPPPPPPPPSALEQQTVQQNYQVPPPPPTWKAPAPPPPDD